MCFFWGVTWLNYFWLGAVTGSPGKTMIKPECLSTLWLVNFTAGRTCQKWLIPAWRLWARSSWGGRWSCGWERMWSPERHCSCGDSGRCQPLPPISRSLPPACWHRPSAGSLWRSCYWSDKKRETCRVIIMSIYLSIYRSVYLCIDLSIYLSIRVNTYIIEMLGCFHDVRSSLVLVILHPALTKELPVEKKLFWNDQQ